jgi:hypothetical protein
VKEVELCAGQAVVAFARSAHENGKYEGQYALKFFLMPEVRALQFVACCVEFRGIRIHPTQQLPLCVYKATNTHHGSGYSYCVLHSVHLPTADVLTAFVLP